MDASDRVPSYIELVVRAQSGDGAAVNELASCYRPQLQTWLRSSLPAGSGLDADDLVERALIHVLARLGELRFLDDSSGEPRETESALRAYLRLAFINFIRDRIRRAIAHPPPL